jgi:ribosomal protein L17
MPRQEHEIISTTINLFKQGKIICKSVSLAKEVIKFSQKIITIFKKGNDIEAINYLNNLNIKRKKGETIDEKIDNNVQISLLNKIRLCIKKLYFGKSDHIYDIIQNHIIPIAFENRNRNGGYISKKYVLSNILNKTQYKNIIKNVQLTVLKEHKEDENGGKR